MRARPRGIIAIILGAASISWIFGSIVVRSTWLIPKRRARPSTGEDLTLPSRDGLRLAATFWAGAQDDAPGLLILHGFAASRRIIQPNAEWFAASGYAVLTIDLRGHGESERALVGLGWTESLDAHAAFAWLKRRQNGAPVAVIGISMGGAATLLGPLGPLPADALVLQATFASLNATIRSRIAFVAGVDAAWVLTPMLALQSRLRLNVWPGQMAPIKMLPRLACPVFVIGGERDRFTPPDECRDLFEAARGPKRLWIALGLGHKGISDTQCEVYRTKVLRFLDDSIGPP